MIGSSLTKFGVPQHTTSLVAALLTLLLSTSVEANPQLRMNVFSIPEPVNPFGTVRVDSRGNYELNPNDDTDLDRHFRT